MSVLCLKQGNYLEGLKASKKAGLLMEPWVFSHPTGMTEERLQILLIAYFNMAICCEKVGDIPYAKKVLDYGVSISQAQLGTENFFTTKFKRKLTSVTSKLVSPFSSQTRSQYQDVDQH
jgi:hypothetical protein